MRTRDKVLRWICWIMIGSILLAWPWLWHWVNAQVAILEVSRVAR